MKLSRIFVVLSVLFLSALACQATGQTPSPLTAPEVPTAIIPLDTSPLTANTNPASQQDVLTNLYQKVSPGIVAIQVTNDQGGSLGSGFVHDTQGNIVTNYHVVEGASQVEVDFMSGFKIYGTVIGTDLDSDLAVV